MSNLNAGAAAWTPQPSQGATTWSHYPPREGSDDEDDDGDVDPGHLAWAEEQAELARTARMHGEPLAHPHDGPQPFVPRRYQHPAAAGPPTGVPPTMAHPTHAPNEWHWQQGAAMPPAVGPSAYSAPMVSVGAQPEADETASVLPPETVMSTATSIQVGVAVRKPTGKEKRKNYAKEAAKEQRRRVIAEKSGLEAFSEALLHSVSPFMAPLRQSTGSSLPHIKVDQRYGRRGQPQTAVTQFVVAPVVNYRPAHFHDIAPGDVLEFHFDLSLVLKVIKTATSLNISYGEWKPYALPYAYLSCKDYKNEVLRLCPSEMPNAKGEAVYEEDVMKDVTPLILAVPELEVFKKKSFVNAIRSRANLYPMYAVFSSLFSGIKSYQIQIRDLHSVPPTFVLKTSRPILAESPQPIVIADSAELWPLLKVIAPTLQRPEETDTQVAEHAKDDAADDEADAPKERVEGLGLDRQSLILATLATVTAGLAVALVLLPPRRR